MPTKRLRRACGAQSVTNATTSGTSAPIPIPVPSRVAANSPRVGATALSSIQIETHPRLIVIGARLPQMSPAQPAVIAPMGIPSAVTLPSSPRVAGVAPHGW